MSIKRLFILCIVYSAIALGSSLAALLMFTVLESTSAKIVTTFITLIIISNCLAKLFALFMLEVLN